MADAVIEGGSPARHWTRLDDGRVRCDVCPRECVMREGQRGLCFVRGVKDGGLVLTTDGRSSGFCIDPIEKKPLNHFLPGTPVLSFGTAGCNLSCNFCQNWDISKSREMDKVASEASPRKIALTAKRYGCQSVAFTYNDPIIFLEYAVEVARACRAEGIRTVAVTAGYMHDDARREFFAEMDAANVDLKAFTERFYKTVTKSSLEPVKDTLRHLVNHTKVWTEITTLLIPGENDGDAELEEMCAWIMSDLGPDVPLHFSAFHPDYRMKDKPPTPPETLFRARRIAKRAGIRHVYTGNIHDVNRQSTYCAGCGDRVIERDWYRLSAYRLDAEGRCLSCGTQLPGVFEGPAGTWGRKRVPVAMG